MFPVIRKLSERKIIRNSLQRAWFRFWFETSHQHFTCVFLCIYPAVGITKNREVGRQSYFISYNIKMLRCKQRYIYSCHQSNFPPPKTSTVNHNFGCYVSLVGINPCYTSFSALNSRNFNSFKYSCSSHFCALSQSLCYINRISLTVFWQKNGTF